MPTHRTTDEGVTTGADIFNVIDNNADVLDTAIAEMVQAGNGSLMLTRIDGGTGSVLVSLAQDGVYSGIVATLGGLQLSYTPGTLQKDGIRYQIPPGTVNLAPNIGAQDRLDAVVFIASTQNIIYATGVTTQADLSSLASTGVILWLIVMPAGEDGTRATCYFLPQNRRTQETQPLALTAAQNQVMASNGVAWIPAGMSETVDAETFQVQQWHHGGTLYIAPGSYYDGQVAGVLPEHPGKGWHTTLLDMATPLGDPACPMVQLSALGDEGAPMVNGQAQWTSGYEWRRLEVFFDGTQYIVTP